MPTSTEFVPPHRLLMGAGPANVDPRVLRALGASLLGHLDPNFLGAMDDVREMLRYVFQTENPVTLPISGTGTAGMEAALVNIIEPGDTFVLAVNGYFGQRLGEIASRNGANVVEVEHEFGRPVDPARVRETLAGLSGVKAVGMVHAETSTGVGSPVKEVADAAHEAGALLVVDAVTSLGGVELRVDEWGVDVCYSCTQKCVGAPPGLAPLTMSPRAMEVVQGRSSKVRSFYLDLTELGSYWDRRAYHHTAPISMIYALREALRLIVEEGLEARWARHQQSAAALRAGVEAMGLSIVADEDVSLPSLMAVVAPEGVNEAQARKHMLEAHDVELSGGLGPLAGKVWRVGLMGHNSTGRNVLTVLSALEDAMAQQGYETQAGAGVAAAQRALRGAD